MSHPKGAATPLFSCPDRRLAGAAPWLLVCLCLLAGAAYWPALSGGFFFDDLPNIVFNDKLLAAGWGWQALALAAGSSDAGLLGRPVSMLSFAADLRLFGMDAQALKRTSLLIHLLSMGAVYLAARALFRLLQNAGQINAPGREPWLAALTAGLWGLHPLQGTAVFYIVQRMTSLCGLFVFLGLAAYLTGRLCQQTGGRGGGWIALAFLLCLPLAVLSKENGALLPVFILLVEIFFTRWQADSPGQRRLLRAVSLLTVALPAGLAAAYLAVNPAFVTAGYGAREFTLAERLWSEGRILWQYLAWAVLPVPGQLGLFHDDIAISRGWFDPWTTLPAAAGMLALAALALWGRRRFPLAAFAIAWFLAGHLMESTVLPLELIFEHRNYVPLFGPCFAAVAIFAGQAPSQRQGRRGALILAGIAALAWVSHQRAAQYDHPLAWAVAEAANHPDSGRANYAVARYLIWMARNGDVSWQENEEKLRYFLARSLALKPSDPGPALDMLLLEDRLGPAVDARWRTLAEARLGSRQAARFAALQLAEFVHLWESGPRRLPAAWVEALLLKAAGHDEWGLEAKTAIQMQLSNFYRIIHAPDRAVAAAGQAVAAMPDLPETHLELTRAALLARDFLLARKSLEESRRLDVHGLRHGDIADLEAILKAVEGRET